MSQGVPPGIGSFDPDVKCCSYLPSLANFTVGQVLLDDDPAAAHGRASVRARIGKGLGVTPLGLWAAPGYDLLYRFGSTHGFGHSRRLRCPHYVEDSGGCGIWRHRNAVCATWFCKHVRGEAGFRFWESVRQLLSTIELELSRWCVLELDVGARALERLFAPAPRSSPAEGDTLTLADLEDRPAAATDPALWGRWAGREADFYAECARLAAGFDLAEVRRRCGPAVRIAEELVRASWERLVAPAPPDRLRVRRLTVVAMSHAACRVSTYSGLDPLEMPRALFDVLPYFDGRPSVEVLRAIRDSGGPALGRGLVHKMVDFGVLEAAVAEPPGPGAPVKGPPGGPNGPSPRARRARRRRS